MPDATRAVPIRVCGESVHLDATREAAVLGRRRTIDAARRGEHGYSLIELLVVVTILGVLAAITIPQLLTQRDRAREAVVMADLRHAVIVITDYSIHHQGDLPPDWDAVLEAGHVPSPATRIDNGAEVQYRPEDGCLSIAHAQSPDLPIAIRFDDNRMLRETHCDDLGG